MNALCGCLGSLGRFLVGSDASYAQLLGRAGNLFPFPGRMGGRTPKLVWPIVCCLQTQIRQNCLLSSEATETTGWALLMGGEASWVLCLGTAAKQERSPPRSECWLPQWSGLADSPSDPHEMRPKNLLGNTPQCWRNWMTTLASLFPVEKLGPRTPLGVMLFHPREGRYGQRQLLLLPF